MDTIDRIGTGRYNGVDGYTIEFTLVDTGEPGAKNRPDRAALRIYETANPGNVVLPPSVQADHQSPAEAGHYASVAEGGTARRGTVFVMYGGYRSALLRPTILLLR